MMRSTSGSRRLVAIRWRMTSVSEVDWKIEPRRCSRSCERQRVGEIAVVGDGEAAAGELGEERLDVALDRAAVGGVADVADGAVAGEPVDDRASGEAVADQADMALGVELRAVEGDDAGRFLAAMLEGVQAERRSGRRRPGARRRRRRRIPRGACRLPREAAWSVHPSLLSASNRRASRRAAARHSGSWSVPHRRPEGPRRWREGWSSRRRRHCSR